MSATQEERDYYGERVFEQAKESREELISAINEFVAKISNHRVRRYDLNAEFLKNQIDCYLSELSYWEDKD